MFRIFRWRRAEKELNDEMQFHLDREIQEQLKAGVAPADARRAAIRAMGAIEKSKEECRDLRPERRFADAGQDLRFAFRLFRKHPGPIGMAVAGLALTMGVATSVFSIANATMFRQYGMDDPSSVVSVAYPREPAWVGLAYAEYVTIKQATSLAAIEASIDATVRVSLTAESAGVKGRPASFVSGGYLPMLGGRTALGRALEPADDLVSAAPVVVVSHHFWTSVLGSDPAAIGRTLWVNDEPVTLVGVMRPDFTGPVEIPRQLWAPMSIYDDVRMGAAITPTTAPRVEVTARLQPGATRQALQDNLSAVVAPFRITPAGSSRPVPQGVDVYSAASPLGGPPEPDVWAGLAIVLTIVGLVLVLACANTSNLLVASAITRAPEIGVRLAMGASRGRLVAQMVRESLLMGLVAGGLGFLLAFWMVPFFGSIVEIPAEANLTPDWRVLLVTAATALLCGLAAGLSPARFGARGNVLAALRSQTSARGGALVPSRLRISFVGFQAAVSALLLVLSVLLTRSAITMTRVDAGFDIDRIVGVRFEAPRKDFNEPAYIRAAMAAVRDLPSVQRASVAQYQPFYPSTWHEHIRANGKLVQVSGNLVDEHFVEAMGLRMVQGRAFTGNEVSTQAPVVVISENLAHLFFPGRSAIGQSLDVIPSADGLRQLPAIVAGVVHDALLGRVGGENFGSIFLPLAEKRSNPPALIVRTATPGGTAIAIEAALHGLDPRVRVQTAIIRDGLERFLESKRRFAWLFGPIAVLALVLSALGMYGVAAFVANQRTEEIGVRMALGASSGDVLRMLASDSLRPVVIGLGLGLGAALVLGQLVAEELAGISPHDPLSIGLALSILLASALAAVLLPAWRAARTDPSGLLRQG